jgi:SAM-dependent methyltransferase
MLLLALTSHMTMDLAPIPLLWILPLAIYLLSFILCFDAARWYRRLVFLGLLPVALGASAYLSNMSPADLPNVLVPIVAYSVAFFVCCMFCHGELARLKPHPRYLTGFYLMLSVGGAIGGVFVALLAPYLFNAYYELPISIAFCGVLALVVLFREPAWPFGRDYLGWPAIAAFTVLAVLIGYQGRTLRDSLKGNMYLGRNFYGGLKVTQYNGYYDWRGYRTLAHGSINHGEQYTHPARRHSPTTYYCPDTGPGRFLASSVVGTPQRVAIIGLGTGTMAAYGRPGDAYRFYEINPLVPYVANTYFTYLKDSDAIVDIQMGDARLSLERQEPQHYDLIAVDAFSSDSIPVHLLTREALQLYFRHLAPQGVLAVHISNRYINLEPVLERGATSLGKTMRVYETDDNEDQTCYGTTWVLMASDASIFQRDELKMGVKPSPAPWLQTWTDDYSNIYKVLRARRD